MESGELKALTEDLCSTSPDDIVVIGGVALGLYDSSRKYQDLDLVVTLKGAASLKKVLRSGKSDSSNKTVFIAPDGPSVNAHVEGRHILRFTFDDLAREACHFGNTRVACLEHLLLLELAAAGPASTRQKVVNANDIVWLVRSIGQYQENTPILDRNLSERDMEILEALSPQLLKNKGDWILGNNC